jgi:predicted DNA-binding transcriptional regulator YafY
MNRVDRLLGYLLVFQGHYLVRAQDLATRFEVSERTVYRDIEALYEVGVPLVGMPGEGYQLMPGYYLPPVMFSEGEAKALFLAIAMLTGLTDPGPTHEAAQTALEKVRAVLPKATLAQVEALRAVLGFHNLGRHKLDLDNPTFQQLQQAIHEHRVVHLHYHAQRDNQVTERAVEPLQLAYLDNVWILSGYCRLRQDQRAFRLDRIDRLRVTKERFAVRPLRNQRPAPGGEEIVVWVDEAIARWVREVQHFAFLREETIDGQLHMIYRLRDQEKLLPWLLQWGEQVEILAPAELHQEMVQRVRAMADRYRIFK